MKRFILSIIFVIFGYFFSMAQCAMCRVVLESETDLSQAEAVNNGIVYLMILPYAMVVIVGVLIYRTYKKTAPK